MKRVMVHGPGDVRLEDVSKPSARPDDVLVQLKAAGICGSEFTYVAQGGAMRMDGEPFGLGHEFGGANVSSFKLGDRVAYNSFNWPHPEGLRHPLDFYEDITELTAAEQQQVMSSNLLQLLEGRR